MTRQRGFTLIELMISMTLLSFIMMMLFSGLRFGYRSWDAITENSETTLQMYHTQAYLRRLISSLQIIQPRKQLQKNEPLKSHLILQGEAQTLIFLGGSPAYAVAGLHYHQLSLADDDGRNTKTLLFSFYPYYPEGIELEDFNYYDPVALISDIEQLEFHYYGQEDKEIEAVQWHQRWTSDSAAPMLIKLTYKTTWMDEQQILTIPILSDTKIN
jgi:general secretion pathway protein J